PAELDAILLDRGTLQRFQRHHHQLVAGLGFERGELVGQRCARGGIEDIGLVHDAAAECRKIERDGGNDGKQEERKRSTGGAPAARSAHRQNFTCGGRVTSSATVKVSIGLLFL